VYVARRLTEECPFVFLTGPSLDGIMNLLKEAEKEASGLVQEARKYRVDKLKEAKLGAEQAIKAYRAELECGHQASLSANKGSAGAAGSQLESDTDKEITALSAKFSTNKEDVAKMICSLVCDTLIEVAQART
jgi:V-type H+-transporting ATPase subunit G